MRLSPGEVICGKYRIVRAIAEGGMGTVYEARHEMLGTAVALKMLHPDLARRQGLVARFIQEARVSAQIKSAHVVQVTDVEQEARGPFLVMELLAGESLQQRMDRERRLDRSLALDLALQVLAGLAAAHAMGVVHRDLKPDNVFLVPTAQGTLAKVLDFGIAKLRAAPEAMAGLTRPGVVLGTAEYMAPEQAFSADTVDARADLYAVGVMLFEMLTGRRPVDGADAQSIARAVFEGRVTSLSACDPGLPPGLVAAVHRAMDPRPSGRFASAEEMQRALLPFVTVLSGAGHQAAALATGHFAMTPPPSSVMPRTLPPETPPRQGNTTAPREPLAQAMTPSPAHAHPQTPGGYDARTHLSPGPPPAHDDGYPGARISYGPPPQSHFPSPPAYLAPPPRRGAPPWLIAVLAAVAGGLGVVLVLMLRPTTSGDTVPPPPATATATATTPASVAPIPPPSTTPIAPPPVTTHPPTPTHAGPPSSSARRPDAGAPDAGFPGFPPFPDFFDAGLPPLPSALPTAITIPLPQFPPPP